MGGSAPKKEKGKWQTTKRARGTRLQEKVTDPHARRFRSPPTRLPITTPHTGKRTIYVVLQKENITSNNGGNNIR